MSIEIKFNCIFVERNEPLKTKVMKNPIIGQEIYVYSSYYVYRGEDDHQGGKAKINRIKYSDHLPKDHINYCMVGIESNPSTMYNYKSLMAEQKELSKRYKDCIAHADPDLRDEFNCPDADWK